MKIRQRLMRAGVFVETDRTVLCLCATGAVTGCVFTGEEEAAEADAVVLVTARPQDGVLYSELHARQPEWAQSRITSVCAIGDAWTPATIAAAVWSGRRYAEELDAPALAGPVPFRREMTALVPGPGEGAPVS